MSKGLSRKADESSGQQKRMLLLDQEKCKPNMPAFTFLQKYARSCGKECITVQGNECKILEEACLACLNRAKHCPGDAVRIINLPANLETDCTHRYGLNSFKLHGLPTPRPGHVLGLLGTNGIGKSTALNVLAGKLKPNLGKLKDPPAWMGVLLRLALAANALRFAANPLRSRAASMCLAQTPRRAAQRAGAFAVPCAHTLLDVPPSPRRAPRRYLPLLPRQRAAKLLSAPAGRRHEGFDQGAA